VATLKSSLKDIKRNRKRQVINMSIKSRVKTMVSKVTTAQTVEEARALLPKAFSAIDKAASKGVLHRNTAARKKSYLVRSINTMEKRLQGEVVSTPPA